jgi:delta1-piperideine-2-carboxylate reductase
MQDQGRQPFTALVDRLVPIFERGGCSTETARSLAFHCAAAERDGQLSHGVFRVPGYLAILDSGWADGLVEPVVEDAAPGLVRVDGRNGFTQRALSAGRALLVEKARRNGIAAMAIRHAHHFAALYLDVEPFAEEGLVALTVVNALPGVTPFGAREMIYGTNPIAFAAPNAAGPPFVFDLATSTMAFGDVLIAAREGHALPPGTGIDRDRNPTTDPRAIIEGGALLPMAGHKGASIATMIEILCAAYGGGPLSYELDRTGDLRRGSGKAGQTLIVIDPTTGAGDLPPLADRVGSLIGRLREAGVDRLPGDRRIAARRAALEAGVPLTGGTREILNRHGA